MRNGLPCSKTVFIATAVVWLATSALAMRQSTPSGAGTPPPMQLEVLPKDWTREQVDLVMETFNTSLGVDCDYCHAEDPDAPAPAPGEAPLLDYASDDKQEKAVSRRMISLVMAINEDLEDEIVSCFTCHNGTETPAFTPSQGWGRGRFTLTPAGPTVPADDTAPASRGTGP